jgi:thermolysin
VIGDSYPPLSPTNRVVLGGSRARAVAEREIGREGEWLNHLTIDPESRRLFYRVESRRFASRWHYWIDAETGRVLRRYDGLNTGEGIGVKGDVKDLTGLTTFRAQKFELRSGDGRQTIRRAESSVLALERPPPAFLDESPDGRPMDGARRTSPGQARSSMPRLRR